MKVDYALSHRQSVSALILIDAVGIGYMNPIIKTSYGKKAFSALVYWMIQSKLFQIYYAKSDFNNNRTELFQRSTED